MSDEALPPKGQTFMQIILYASLFSCGLVRTEARERDDWSKLHQKSYALFIVKHIFKLELGSAYSRILFDADHTRYQMLTVPKNRATFPLASIAFEPRPPREVLAWQVRCHSMTVLLIVHNFSQGQSRMVLNLISLGVVLTNVLLSSPAESLRGLAAPNML